MSGISRVVRTEAQFPSTGGRAPMTESCGQVRSCHPGPKWAGRPRPSASPGLEGYSDRSASAQWGHSQGLMSGGSHDASGPDGW